MTWPW